MIGGETEVYALLEWNVVMVYVFGDYTLDMRRYELRRAKQRVALEPKAFDLLELEALISEATYGQLSTVYNQ